MIQKYNGYTMVYFKLNFDNYQSIVLRVNSERTKSKGFCDYCLPLFVKLRDNYSVSGVYRSHKYMHS